MCNAFSSFINFYFPNTENRMYNGGSGPDRILLQQRHSSRDYENTSTISDISCTIHAAPYDIPKSITRSHHPYDIPNPVIQSLVLNSESVSYNRQLFNTEDESALVNCSISTSYYIAS